MRSVETAVQASPAVAPATAAAAPHPPRPVRSRTSFDFSVPARTPKPSVALPAFAETAASASALKRSVGQQPETAALTRTGFDEVPDLSQFPEELQVLLRQVAAGHIQTRCFIRNEGSCLGSPDLSFVIHIKETHK